MDINFGEGSNMHKVTFAREQLEKKVVTIKLLKNIDQGLGVQVIIKNKTKTNKWKKKLTKGKRVTLLIKKRITKVRCVVISKKIKLPTKGNSDSNKKTVNNE